jgi:hypothetical protein
LARIRVKLFPQMLGRGTRRFDIAGADFSIPLAEFTDHLVGV